MGNAAIDAVDAPVIEPQVGDAPVIEPPVADAPVDDAPARGVDPQIHVKNGEAGNVEN